MRPRVSCIEDQANKEPGDKQPPSPVIVGPVDIAVWLNK